MWKRRISWILIIISAALLYLFANETITLALLIICILAPVVSTAVLMLSSDRIGVTLEPGEITKDGVTFNAVISNQRLMPLAEIEVPVECVHLRTGQSDSLIVNGTSSGRKDKVISITAGINHAGRYELTAKNARLMDPLRLWSKDIKLNQEAAITVMPDQFDIRLSVTNSAAAMLDSEQLSRLGKGIEPGEVRSIREYAPGDPIKNIHWKLSEKTDKLLVKELELPMTGEILAILDTYSENDPEFEDMDAIAAVYVSLLRSLVTYDMDFSAGWIDPETSLPVIRQIRTEQELLAAADEFLATPRAYQSAVDVIEKVLPESRYAHIIVIGSEIPDSAYSISSGCQVTLMMCGSESSMTVNEGAAIVGFSNYSYEADLAVVEI
jgi:uncharacterized protein (DUF58 family)